MFWKISLVISCLKLLFIHAYKSTDFEVHRNWMAIVDSLPLNEWYVSDVSPWTLDYPPLFAWMEKCFSCVASYIDPQMLVLTNLNYDSFATVVFQKLSVIITDYVLVYAIISYAEQQKRRPINGQWTKELSTDPRLLLILLVLGNTGLFIVDHIHFQYNGILFGLLILSILRISQERTLEGAFWFFVLLNMKHIFLYIAPAFGVFLLRNACFKSKKDGRIEWKSFSLMKCFQLAAVVLSVSAVSFGPFVFQGQLFQVLSRLFPFKRGLCHAYWAPNFWALYNVLDKLLVFAGSKMKLLSSLSSASMTGGLVQEFDHTILPSIRPHHTFLLTFFSMLPILLKTWLSPQGILGFVKCITMCAFSAFMFGWHVHEKAILLIIIPLILLTVNEKRWAKLFLLASTIGHYSLFPLIYTSAESPIKFCLFLIYAVFAFYSLGKVHSAHHSSFTLPFLDIIETAYVLGFFILHLYSQCFHHLLRLDERLPFLPLLLTSVYSAVGIFWIWIVAFKQFLSNK